MAYIKNVLIGFDQFLNSLLGGYPDETVSARAFRCNWALYPLLNFLFFWDKNHCEESYKSELKHNQSPPEER